jgi:hypothetical protein
VAGVNDEQQPPLIATATEAWLCIASVVMFFGGCIGVVVMLLADNGPAILGAFGVAFVGTMLMQVLVLVRHRRSSTFPALLPALFSGDPRAGSVSFWRSIAAAFAFLRSR